MRPSARMVAAAILVVAGALAGQPARAAAAPAAPPTWEWREVFSPDGAIKEVRVRGERRASMIAPSRITATVTPLQRTGPSGSRFDLVIVGDGYTSSQLDTFHQHAAAKWREISAVEPFRRLRNYFNVWMVDVVSPQSGVDNDPFRGVSRSTALDMRFWCGGIERLLCVNEPAALAYARSAPQTDQVVAIANSTTYGGAGGGVATASGGNSRSGQVVVHELGHSIGGLADEYDYGRPGRYSGGEPREPNVSVYPAGTMRRYGLKWASYLGRSTPDGGVIWTYEGARYYRSGIYRPSRDSLMRTLGRPFNSVGHDVMWRAIMRYVF